ncbi:MAG: 1-acyl-sn-glycerol-3-phosphate acyltransferase [Myxococcota bacterium]
MLRGFGPLYYLLGLPFFFRNLRMEDHSAERVRKAAEAGPVVFVLHTRSHVDWLALNRVLVDRRLPLPVFTNGVDATGWMPVGDAARALVRRVRGETPPDAIDSGWLAQTLAGGRPVCVFLVPPRDAVLPRREEPDPIPALLEAQARTERPIQVLPVVVIWNRSPEPARTEVGRFLLGTEDNPGALGKLLALTTRQGDALVQVGEPIALADWAARYGAEPASRRLKALRLVLRRYLYREARVVRGPRARPRGFVRRQVLQSREVADLVAREAAATGLPVERVEAKVAKTFDHIAARFSFPAVRIAAWACRQIWNRIYSGVDVRPEDIDRIRAALRAGTPILVPCHRSHLDYLLISSLLYEHDVVIPHIVAGENLSFWPLGAMFRRMGAFFVRRSFSGDRVFPVVFARYLHELVRTEVPVEFFIEGGRSRTGKLLPPKAGVLGMVLDAAADAREDREVTFLPIYINYEQIAEERAYARELQGARKEKEDVAQVVKATGVLKNRYGKVYLRVGEPLSARGILGGVDWPSLPKARRHEILMATGERLLHRINAQAIALPTALVATAILAHPRRGVRHEELRARVERLRQFLAAAGVPEAGSVRHVDGILEEALGRFAKGKMVLPLEEDHGRVWSIVAERRVTLEYYKNTLIHAFAPAAYYATAVRALGSDTVDRDAVARRFRLQQFLLRYEFVLDPDADVYELEARAVRALVAYGALRDDGDAVQVVERVRVTEIANLVANFLESYLLVLRTIRAARSPLAPKDLSRDALALGKTLLAVDEIARPEALNLANLENAVRAFEEEGVLAKGADGRLVDVPELSGPYVRDLCHLLGVDESKGERA